ncbi:amidohydrolase family protein [Gordonia hydrophobica]|uniref:Amidohydrolase family protein n=1 Tax=Gordonia hydrophobica TaxID=40516 RepID=A0ABZ2U6E6_9ACTN|nr:amidohydrolase family protein [Gordonia hydrophobica]MBM7365380.1 putative TIM-barrel fold metal-dependent hydrolase [Gordonia hydrophobica]
MREAAPAGSYLPPTERRHERSDEEILDPDLEIIDAHHHLYDRPGARYLLDEYAGDVALGHRIVGSVYIEIMAMARTWGPEHLRSIGEIEFANGIAAMAATGFYGDCDVAAAIVGYADLRRGHAVGEVLDEAIARAPERFRGIRQITLEYDDPAMSAYISNPPPRGILDHPDLVAGLRELGRRGLVYDANAFHHRLSDFSRLADEVPETVFALNHTGFPLLIGLSEDQRREEIAAWRRDLRELASRPNVVCKVGGLGQVFLGFGFDSRPVPPTSRELASAWEPFVVEAIDAFGADRCMMMSNFPVDGRSCGFVPYWNALKYIVRGASREEKEQLFQLTAERVYRIDRPSRS